METFFFTLNKRIRVIKPKTLHHVLVKMNGFPPKQSTTKTWSFDELNNEMKVGLLRANKLFRVTGLPPGNDKIHGTLSNGENFDLQKEKVKKKKKPN